MINLYKVINDLNDFRELLSKTYKPTKACIIPVDELDLVVLQALKENFIPKELHSILFDNYDSSKNVQPFGTMLSLSFDVQPLNGEFVVSRVNLILSTENSKCFDGSQSFFVTDDDTIKKFLNREPIYFCENYELKDYIILIQGLNKKDVKCFEDIERPNDSVVLLDKNRNLITIDTSLEEFLKTLDCPIYYINIDYWADNYDDIHDYYEGLKDEFNFEEFLNCFKDNNLISLEELFINPLEYLEDYDTDSWHLDSFKTLIMNKVNLYGNKDYEIGGYDLFKHQPRLYEFKK